MIRTAANLKWSVQCCQGQHYDQSRRNKYDCYSQSCRNNGLTSLTYYDLFRNVWYQCFLALRLLANTALLKLCFIPFLFCLPVGNLCLTMPASPSSSSPPTTICTASLVPSLGLPCRAGLLPLILKSLLDLAVAWTGMRPTFFFLPTLCA